MDSQEGANNPNLPGNLGENAPDLNPEDFPGFRELTPEEIEKLNELMSEIAKSVHSAEEAATETPAQGVGELSTSDQLPDVGELPNLEGLTDAVEELPTEVPDFANINAEAPLGDLTNETVVESVDANAELGNANTELVDVPAELVDVPAELGEVPAELGDAAAAAAAVPGDAVPSPNLDEMFSEESIRQLREAIENAPCYKRKLEELQQQQQNKLAQIDIGPSSSMISPLFKLQFFGSYVKGMMQLLKENYLVALVVGLVLLNIVLFISYFNTSKSVSIKKEKDKHLKFHTYLRI
ncbi:skeleton-binding protein 1, putative (SBP1) [Plasmodium ovale wallikeri]|uniref:Skeleton-binding protein 1, putative (SBP1) n=1 Tax=Plasmodium ovale wallikeri TaxID=864142 RepID=A0A1A8YYT4_PLAOA|nr:skeleton-binding protein 1, putative (SBP1) [Plasmodium ovale wallikeri]SBT57252.1 skeleton-binding protein 1, putative (SBP1) [Plasmodium ovale wallikeri]